jgi:MGT family glycosyltransferase
MWTGAVPGHVTPCAPIARRLVDRGHEVLWITGRHYQEDVEATGAQFHPYPEELDPGAMEIYDFYPELKALKGLAQVKYWIKHVFLDGCPSVIESIDRVLDEFPADVLIGDTVAFGLVFKCEMTGLPNAHISILPLSLPSRDIAPWGLGLLPGKSLFTKARNRALNFLLYHILLRDVTRHANGIRRTLGLPPLECPFFQAMYDRNMLIAHTSAPVFEYVRTDQPESLQFIGPILPELDTAFQEPRWWNNLDGSRPVILVNQGTLAKTLEDLIVPTISAFADDDVSVVAVPVRKGDLNDLPAHVYAEPFVCFGHLLPHIDVMVTNGGYGGTQRALAQGIPLVVAGETEDKMEVAARVEWCGAGINLRKKRPSPDEIRTAVKEVLSNPVYRNNARRIQTEFASYDAPTRAAELLEALAEKKKD